MGVVEGVERRLKRVKRGVSVGVVEGVERRLKRVKRGVCGSG